MSTPKATANSFIDRYWARVDIRTPDECWPWTGVRNYAGYGQLTICPGPPIKCTSTGAHRVALWLDTGIFPRLAEHYVCDNPPCQNPHHLRHSNDMLNQQTRVAHGHHHNANKELCPQGHPYDRVYPNGLHVDGSVKFARKCSICLNRIGLASWYRQQARKLVSA